MVYRKPFTCGIVLTWHKLEVAFCVLLQLGKHFGILSMLSCEYMHGAILLFDGYKKDYDILRGHVTTVTTQTTDTVCACIW